MLGMSMTCKSTIALNKNKCPLCCRQVLIELGPSYFRYMDRTAKKPSVMAKLLGFFTVELKNLETGAIQSKADLLIMENLFYDRKISQTFDLKGIEGRKIKPSGKGPQSKTLFDGEWLEGAPNHL
jgi:1-phosphatidylinositol-3-phosphate 5-kinase